MTRETIEELTRLLDSGDWMPDSSDAGDLLMLAERALDLEDAVRLFLAEADSDERGNLWAGRETISKLCAAYRAEAKS